MPPVPVPRPAEFRAARAVTHERALPRRRCAGPTLTVVRRLAVLLLAALQGRAAQRLRGAAAAAGDGGGTRRCSTVTDYIELTGHHRGGRHGPAGGPRRGLPRADPFPGRRAGQEGRPAVHHPAGHTTRRSCSRRRRRSAPSRRGWSRPQTEFARYSGLFKQKAASAVDVDTWRANLDGRRPTCWARRPRSSWPRSISATRRSPHRSTAAWAATWSMPATWSASAARPPCWPRSTGSTRSTPTSRSTSASCCASARERPRPAAPASPTTRCCELGVADEEGFPHKGKLDFAAISLTAGTGTLQLRGIFPNPDYRLLPGLFVRIRAPFGERAGRAAGPRDGDRPRPGRRLRADRRRRTTSSQRTGIELGQLVGIEPRRRQRAWRPTIG